MVTLEEEHSTRGRAHMLFEVLQGEVVRDGWKDEHVKKALDLCLSCKACKSECPTNVDVATYKAEFLAHYYEGSKRRRCGVCLRHDRPLGATWIEGLPRLANFFSQRAGLSPLLQSALHLAPQRRVPQLARSTFQSWARKNAVSRTRGTNGPDREKSVSFCGRILSTIIFVRRRAKRRWKCFQGRGIQRSCPANSSVLRQASVRFRMLDRPSNTCERILSALTAPIMTPVSRSSCWSRVVRPSFAMSCAIFFQRMRAPWLAKPDVSSQRVSGAPRSRIHSAAASRKSAVARPLPSQVADENGDEESLLRKMGADLQSIDSGCCGMAGPFGFDKEKYASRKRWANECSCRPCEMRPDALIVSDGFSCREQICNPGAARHLDEARNSAYTANPPLAEARAAPGWIQFGRVGGCRGRRDNRRHELDHSTSQGTVYNDA
jgi:ferredoxin